MIVKHTLAVRRIPLSCIKSMVVRHIANTKLYRSKDTCTVFINPKSNMHTSELWYCGFKSSKQNAYKGDVVTVHFDNHENTLADSCKFTWNASTISNKVENM